MRVNWRHGLLALSLLGLSTMLGGAGGDGCSSNTSDDTQRQQQETLLAEGTSQVGMPAIKNFRERKLLKDILEKRDQEGLITWTYVENMIPTVNKGHTVMGGKFTFFCDSIGYPIPYSTQFTNPQKQVHPDYHDSAVIAQADPNGLFSPASSEGTWVLCKDPHSNNVGAVYSEPKLIAFPFRVDSD